MPGYGKFGEDTMNKGVLCDTSFFIRLLDKSSDLHQSAKDYFRYLLDQDYRLLISTISIAEYTVGGSITGLPLKNLQILPFNFDHAKRTGQFAKTVFAAKRSLKLTERNLIPNDSKFFAQADIEKSIGFYITSDQRSKKIYDLLYEKGTKPAFEFINLQTPYNEQFGVLGL